MPVLTIPLWINWRTENDGYHAGELTIMDDAGRPVIGPHMATAEYASIWGLSPSFDRVASIDLRLLTKDEAVGIFATNHLDGFNMYRFNSYLPGVIHVTRQNDARDDEWPIVEEDSLLVRTLLEMQGEPMYLEAREVRNRPMPDDVQAIDRHRERVRPKRKRIEPRAELEPVALALPPSPIEPCQIPEPAIPLAPAI